MSERKHGLLVTPANQATSYEYNEEWGMRMRINAMLRQIRNGNADKAAARAREVGHAALRVLARRQPL